MGPVEGGLPTLRPARCSARGALVLPAVLGAFAQLFTGGKGPAIQAVL